MALHIEGKHRTVILKLLYVLPCEHCHGAPFKLILVSTKSVRCELLNLYGYISCRYIVVPNKSNIKGPRYNSGMLLQPPLYRYERNRVIRTVTILDVQWKKSRSFFALVLKLKAECCVCSSAFILYGPYVLSGVQMKRKKKEKKEKKNTIFARGSQPSEIVGVLYRMKMRRKGVFYWKMMRESVLFEWRGRWFRKKEKQWSSAGCVQGRVFWFCCFYV